MTNALAYYNEIDSSAAAWLRELIKGGHIAAGEVDERSIEDVRPDDLRGYTQCHFFAGIGGWSLALRMAGWPDSRPVWTGSCPCQPFSSAGKGRGEADERHLWPAFFHLIEQCRPAVAFGEQVASADGLKWLDLVSADLEATGYAFGAADLCAAGFGAPHIRQRLYWLAYAAGQRQHGGRPSQASDGRDAARVEPERFCDAGGLADADSTGSLPGAHARIHRAEKSDGTRHGEPKRYGAIGGLADSSGERRQQDARGSFGHEKAHGREGWNGCDANCDHIVAGDGQDGIAGPLHGFWRDADWLGCRDGKWRPVEPGTFPLAHGLPARVGRLRGYGNAIVPQVAATFVRAAA